MTREQHLEFCRICTNRSFNPKKGITCKLTDDIADFNPTCELFEKDSEEEQAIYKTKMERAGNTKSGDAMDFKKNKQLGQWILFLGIGALFLPFMIESFSVVIIPFGAIIYGASVHEKGVKQEKIWRENENKEG